MFLKKHNLIRRNFCDALEETELNYINIQEKKYYFDILEKIKNLYRSIF